MDNASQYVIMNPAMIERTAFNRLIRDALCNLYDYAALETHPLASIFPKPLDHSGSRAEYLRHILQRAIEGLQPPDRECTASSTEWRPYLILYGRYVEGVSLQELQTRLALSERQLRREHSRAVQAVAAALWDRVLLEHAPFEMVGRDEQASLGQWENNFRAFKISHEPLDIAAVMHGVTRTLQRRAQSEEVELHQVLPERGALPCILADRVILRQILLSLLNHALDAQSGGDIVIGADVQVGQVALWIQFQADSPSLSAVKDEETTLGVAKYWAQRLNATLQETCVSDVQTGLTRLTLSLPRADRAVVLVVDDQVPAIRMFRRYLSRFNVQVVGVQEPEQVMPLARQLQPQVITLDVMMPTMDGWEILQMLQADPETCHIPVIVCSVWDEPELAFSLGAAGFLKKPITQKDLLSALDQLKLPGMPAGSSLADTVGQMSIRDGIGGDAS